MKIQVKIMFDNLDYIEEKGNETMKKHDLTIYALSTCGFCRKSMNFLREKDIPFRYIYLDEIPLDVKRDVKNKLKEKYDKRVVFPFLEIDEMNAIIGFTQSEWEEKIGI